MPNLPKEMYSGVRALPNPDGDGALLFNRDEMYELKFRSNGWEWYKKHYQLQINRSFYTALYVPDEISEC